MIIGFNPRTYIRYDPTDLTKAFLFDGFNPRTYIRYDKIINILPYVFVCFNPRTYIRYDVTPRPFSTSHTFQSTYLYKVRQYIFRASDSHLGFNPRTYIRYDPLRTKGLLRVLRFNPRTYIRYDKKVCVYRSRQFVSIHVPI